MNLGRKRLKSTKMMLTHSVLEPSRIHDSQPTVIFFTTTAKEALETPPLCHPAIFLNAKNIRVVSFDLPLHSDEIPSFDGVKRWTMEMVEKNSDLIAPFLKEVSLWIDQHLDPKAPLGFMGVSRGAFIAAFLALERHTPVPLVLFSPMQDLDYSWLWDQAQPSFPFLDFYRLSNHATFFKDCPFYLSIGNHDERVSTTKSVSLIQKLLHLKTQEQKRNIPIELHVFPSIGMYGHGTPDRIFEEGAKWMSEQLKT
jgi:predicted esterase